MAGLSILSRFTEGDCHILARVIHEATGWKMATFSNQDWGFPADCHAFVRLPDRRYFDIHGISTEAEMYERWFPYLSLSRAKSRHRINIWDTPEQLGAAAPNWIGNAYWAASERIAPAVAYKLLWQHLKEV